MGSDPNHLATAITDAISEDVLYNILAFCHAISGGRVFRFLTVCKAWRGLIEDCSRFWTTIDIVILNEMCVQRLVRSLQFSKALPLDITLHFHEGDMPRVAAKTSHRVKNACGL
jgi:hypothetical protein